MVLSCFMLLYYHFSFKVEGTKNKSFVKPGCCVVLHVSRAVAIRGKNLRNLECHVW